VLATSGLTVVDGRLRGPVTVEVHREVSGELTSSTESGTLDIGYDQASEQVDGTLRFGAYVIALNAPAQQLPVPCQHQ